MVISVPVQLNPVLRVALCHVMSVPAVVIACTAVRVSVSAAAGASMRSSVLVRAGCESVLITGELNDNHLTSIRFIVECDTLHFACNCGAACYHTHEITEKIVTTITQVCALYHLCIY